MKILERLKGETNNHPLKMLILTIIYITGCLVFGLFFNKLILKSNNKLIYFSIFLFFASILPFILYTSINNRPYKKLNLEVVFCVLPYILLAVNAFPFISLIEESSHFCLNITKILLFHLLNCFFDSLFNVIVFCGIIFICFNKLLNKNKLSLIYSLLFTSAICVLFNCLYNIILKNSINGFLIIYYFYISGACALIFYLTKTVIFSFLLYFIFNIGANLLNNKIIYGEIWIKNEIIITFVLFLIIFIYSLYIIKTIVYKNNIK